MSELIDRGGGVRFDASDIETWRITGELAQALSQKGNAGAYFERREEKAVFYEEERRAPARFS